MQKTIVKFAVVTNNGYVEQIGRGVIYTPPIRFGGGTIKWFDDSKLLKKERTKSK